MCLKSMYQIEHLIIQSVVGKVVSEKSISWSFRSASYRIPRTTCVQLGSNYKDLDDVLSQKQWCGLDTE
jgi:hypothetical protein